MIKKRTRPQPRLRQVSLGIEEEPEKDEEVDETEKIE